jgi:uncharacterized protein YkwD
MIKPILLIAAMAFAAGCSTRTGVQTLSLATQGTLAQAGTLIGVSRAGSGLQPVLHSANLQAAAQYHVDDLSRSGTFSHTGSDGSDVSDRVRRSGYDACFVAENIAQGQPNTSTTIDGWLNSPEHRANILNANATQFGFARTGDIWVLVMARPC